MIVAKICYFWTVFPQISCGRYPPNLSKFPKPHFLLTCTYFRGRRHGRNLPMAKATDGLAFGITRHCRIEGLPPMPPTPITEETAKFDADDEHEDKQQNTSGSLRCEKSQTPSGHEPKTAKTRSKRLFHVTFGIHKKQSFGPQEHMPSLWNHRQFLHWNRSESVSNSGLGIQLQKPQQQQGSCPRHAKREPQKFFHVTFRIHKKQSFGPREIWPWNTASESLEQQNTSGSLRCEKSQTPSGHEPKTAKTRSKKLFHVTFGSHKKQSFGPREIWPWNTASESLEQQNTSGSLRCEKSQTPSGHEPKTAKTWSKRLFHVTFGIHKKQSFGPQGHTPSLSNHRQFLHWNRSESVSNSGLGIYTYKSLNSSKVRAPGMQNTSHKNSFTLRFESTKNNLLGFAKSGLGTPLPKASNSKTQAVALDAKSPKHHLDTSRKRPKPDPKNSFTLRLEATKNNLLGLAKSGLGTPLPKASNSKTQAVALDAKSPKHHLDTSRKRPKPDPKNSFTLPLESTKNNLLGRKGTCPAYQTIVNSSTGIAPKSFRTLVLECTSESLEQQQASCPRYAKHKPEKLSHRTAARFVLKVCKTQARKTLSRYLSYPKKFFWAKSSKTRCKTVAKSGLGTPLPKASNTAKHKR